MITNRSQEEQANEIVREKAFLFLNQVFCIPSLLGIGNTI